MSNKNFKVKTVPAAALRFEGGTEVSVDGDKFSMRPYAGQVFEHEIWGMMAFDMSSLSMRKATIPAKAGHDWSIDVGVINLMEVGDSVEVSGEFIKNDASENIKQMKEKGLEWECSFGMNPDCEIEYVLEGVETEVNGAKFVGPGHIFSGAFHEVSFTHYGAVPGTETSFDNKRDNVEVKVFSNFSKEESMSDTLNQSDLDQSKEEGRAEFKALFSRMNEACSDAAFVNECMGEGLSFEEFQGKLVVKLQADVAERDEKIVELSKEAPATPAAPAADEGPAFEADGGDAPSNLSFAEKARKMVKDEKITFRAAYRKLIASDPAGHQEFKQSNVQEA